MHNLSKVSISSSLLFSDFLFISFTLFISKSILSFPYICSCFFISSFNLIVYSSLSSSLKRKLDNEFTFFVLYKILLSLYPTKKLYNNGSDNLIFDSENFSSLLFNNWNNLTLLLFNIFGGIECF